MGLYLPVYSRSFRRGNTIFSPWRLSRFVTKLFIYIVLLIKFYCDEYCVCGYNPTEVVPRILEAKVFSDGISKLFADIRNIILISSIMLKSSRTPSYDTVIQKEGRRVIKCFSIDANAKIAND